MNRSFGGFQALGEDTAMISPFDTFAAADEYASRYDVPSPLASPPRRHRRSDSGSFFRLPSDDAAAPAAGGDDVLMAAAVAARAAASPVPVRVVPAMHPASGAELAAARAAAAASAAPSPAVVQCPCCARNITIADGPAGSEDFAAHFGACVEAANEQRRLPPAEQQLADLSGLVGEFEFRERICLSESFSRLAQAAATAEAAGVRCEWGTSAVDESDDNALLRLLKPPRASVTSPIPKPAPTPVFSFAPRPQNSPALAPLDQLRRPDIAHAPLPYGGILPAAAAAAAVGAPGAGVAAAAGAASAAASAASAAAVSAAVAAAAAAAAVPAASASAAAAAAGRGGGDDDDDVTMGVGPAAAPPAVANTGGSMDMADDSSSDSFVQSLLSEREDMYASSTPALSAAGGGAGGAAVDFGGTLPAAAGVPLLSARPVHRKRLDDGPEGKSLDAPARRALRPLPNPNRSHTNAATVAAA